MVEPDEFVLDGKTTPGVGKVDAPASITPGMSWLLSKNETELAAIFAAGTAERVPLGDNNGIPVLPHNKKLIPSLAKLYVGSIWEQQESGSGEPLFYDNGDPVVLLRDKFLRTSNGHLLTKYEADVTRGLVKDVAVAPGVTLPTGQSNPHPLIPFFTKTIVIDGKPSLFVNYRRDPMPIVNRILDEIREVDAANCPGLFLGRAHYRRPLLDQWVYLYYFALDFSETGTSCNLP